MAQLHLHIPSFNAGELSPLLGARFAVEKVQSGCRRLRNFIIHAHGPAFRRPGLEDIGAAKSDVLKSRLAGFNFSTTTGFVLEFSPDGLQVWSNGERVPLVNEVALPYSEQDCAELQISQVNDVCYIAHGSHSPMQLTRYADNDWRLAEIPWTWPPLGDENTRPDAVTTPTVTSLLSVDTLQWPEWSVAGGTAYTFSVTITNSTGVSAATKTALLQSRTAVGAAWTTAKTLTWTTAAPALVSGTTTAGAARLWRVTYSGELYPFLGASISFSHGTVNSTPLDIPQPPSATPVTVPAGDWQVVVASAATVPAGASLVLQKKTGTTWANFQTLTLTAGATVETRETKLLVATDFRFIWTGDAMTGGTASMESLSFPVVSDVTLQVSGLAGTGRVMTASESIFKAGHEGSYWQITHRRDNSTAQIVSAVPTIAAATSNEISVSGKWDVFTYGTWTGTLFLERKLGATWDIVRSWVGRSDRNVIASGEEEEPSTLRLRVTAGTSAAASGAAVPRFILECSDSRVNGLVRITELDPLDGNGRTDTATVDVISGLYATTATAIWTEGAFSTARGFPRAVALHGARLWFGGIFSEPTRLWGSVVNDYVNFVRSSFDDASISVTPAAQSSNVIQWMSSFQSDLIFGTKGDEWTLSGTAGVIKPTDIQAQRRSGYGSTYLPAVTVGDALVFVQRAAKRLRQISPRSDAQQWSAVDLTILAEHVGAAGMVSFAMMGAPVMILWVVTGDGKLLGMTFEREQNVFGWHVHNTDGVVESVAVIAGPDADELWLSVLRNGKRRIERLDALALARDFSAPARLMYLDSARRFDFVSPSASLTGLEHLEGRTVTIVGDGVLLASAAVTGGAVTLAAPVSAAVVGLPFTSELQPMRLDIPLRDGTAQHRQWKVTRVGLYVHESQGGEVADSPASRYEALRPPTGSAAGLYTGEVETAIDAAARAGVDVIVRQTGPFPLNVGSITLKGDVYGE